MQSSGKETFRAILQSPIHTGRLHRVFGGADIGLRYSLFGWDIRTILIIEAVLIVFIAFVYAIRESLEIDRS